MQDNGNGGENFGGKINVRKDGQKVTDTRQKYPFTSQHLSHLP